MATPQSPTQIQQRLIRVFISSTFRDMQAERDELVKRIFPQLRKLCEQRGVTWGEVDLRWGVTDEQKAEGEVLPICLDEIRRCRPYFIGLLGERYGWIPNEVPSELIEREPWLAELHEHSVTELEILHGVLNNPDMAGHTFFYFRDPAYLNTLPTKIREEYSEEPTDDEIKIYGLEEAKRQAESRRQKLAALKERIRLSGLPVCEDYPDPPALGELVLRDLTALVNHLYPEGDQPDPLDRDAAEHEGFASSRARVYIGRPAYIEKLDEHARSDSLPLAVLGESGSGKSALLANWALQYQQAHPDDLPLMHFIGTTPESADWAAMLRRILGEFKRRFDIQLEIPDKPDILRAAFANALQMVAAKGRVILIFDALNQLEDRNGAPDLVWLPPVIPNNIRLVLSTLPGRPLDEIQKRGWPTLQVEPLELGERKQLIEAYLAQYSKSLSVPRLERIADSPQVANPLYLQVLLEELRQFGVHEKLDERIDYYLEASAPDDLFEKVLERYEQDYERERPGLVRDALSLLWAARRGLSEAELLELLGSQDGPLQGAYWSPLYLALEQLLLSRGGLIGFVHGYLRKAVRDKYLSSEESQYSAHRRLADYFDNCDIGQRKVDELPWQLAEARDWQRLNALLGDLVFFKTAWKLNTFEIKAYWSLVEANSPCRMVDAYRQVRYLDMDYYYYSSLLLADTGHLDEALALRSYLVENSRQTGNQAYLQATLIAQASILSDQGNPDGAMTLLKEQEQICRETGDKAGLSSSLNNQALILHDWGDLDGAMTLHIEGESIERELGDKAGLAITLTNQAVILYARGNLDRAITLHKEAEQIFREQENKDGLIATFGNQALILSDRGNLDGALALHKEKERLCRELGDKAGLGNTLCNQANILHTRGDLDKAMAFYKEAELIFRKLDDKRGLEAVFGNQAVILSHRGDLDGAMALQKKREHICRELGNKHGLSLTFGNQASILYARGDLDGAITLYQEEERICRELGDKLGLSRTLGNQAVIIKARGDLDGAIALHKEEERVYRELGNKDGLSTSLGNQAGILFARGDLDGALALYMEEERICRELGNKAGLSKSLGKQAMIIKERGDRKGAISLHKEEEAIYRELGDKAGLQDSLGNQAMILAFSRTLEGITEALTLSKEQEIICRELDHKKGLVQSLAMQASILNLIMNQPQNALPLADEAYLLAADLGYTSLIESVEGIRAQIRERLSKP